MAKTIVIVGFGPGTATAVAERFGKEGFTAALIGRDEDRLAAGVSALKAKGVEAFAFRGDAGDSDSIRGAIRAVRSKLGPSTVLFWNAYGGLEFGDILGADPVSVRHLFDAPVFGLLAAVDEALEDLKSSEKGAILVSNGGLGEVSSDADEGATQYHAMGLALSSAAKHKLVGLLAARLKNEGVFVGEVMVYGVIKSASSAQGTIEPATIAEKHWSLYQSRSDVRAGVH
ncbi:MAG TPA: SDR family NAD(P)-dependent oxidoreductase [Candidatus Elarobacter sp.]|jgi:NADP-dependent 3-hydroxy acid dehydrogenase YdfG|nr:SDR family NAD(P)-dependent oxidoreductase [Candidatus Elarobacter sp.]